MILIRCYPLFFIFQLLSTIMLVICYNIVAAEGTETVPDMPAEAAPSTATTAPRNGNDDDSSDDEEATKLREQEPIPLYNLQVKGVVFIHFHLNVRKQR